MTTTDVAGTGIAGTGMDKAVGADRAMTDHEPARTDRGAVITIGFATVVAMWAIGYVCRMPPALAPSWLVLLMMLAAMVAGGFTVGRFTDLGAKGGLLSGLLAAVLNFMIMGSLLSSADGGGTRSALIFVPGALVFAALVGALSAWAGSSVPGRRARGLDWTALMALTGCTATFLLVIAGGLVTSLDAGLAVPDWPNTYGNAMFLYPLSKMTGGVYYEHAHRLFGSLVGLTTIAVAVQIFRTRREPALRSLVCVAVVLVVAQGLLGGLRVTGRLTLATEAESLAPNVTLAIVHGVLGQLFLAVMAALATLTTRLWRCAREIDWAGPRGGFPVIMAGLPVLIVGQLVLGAIVRHQSIGVMAHIGLAIVIGMYAVTAGTLFWSGVRSPARFGWVGLSLIWLSGLQLLLGFAAFVVTDGGKGHPTTAWYEVLAATSHQANGALLLAASVVAALWAKRVASYEPSVPAAGSAT